MPVIVEQPSDDAFRPVDEMVRQGVILIAVALVLAAGHGASLAFGILRPIRRLRAILDAMTRGDHAVRDVTSRKEAEKQRSRMAAIVASSGDAIIGLAGRGIVTDWNGGAERLYGYSAQEMVGRSIECLIPPERGDQFVQVRDQLNRGQPIQNFETQRLRKDGTRVDVSISVSPVIDSTGRIIGAATVARDTTERTFLEGQTAAPGPL